MAAATPLTRLIQRFAVTPNTPASHVQLACCHTHFAVPQEGKNIILHTYSNLEAPLELIGHHGDVSAMLFGIVRGRLVLCSASDDYLIVWDVQRCYGQVERGVIASGRVVGTLLGRVVHLSMCSQSVKLAACSGSKVCVLNAEKEDMPVVLKSHLGPVTACEFCPWDGNLLVSISEDRTFKIWDVRMAVTLFGSAVLSAYPLLSLFFMEQSRQLITGSSDGQIWCYTLPADHKCRLVAKLDLSKLEEKHQRNLRNTRPPQNATEETAHNDVKGVMETAKPVLRIWAQTSQSKHAGMLQRGSCVWVGSCDGLYLLDVDASEILLSLPFRGHLSISTVGSLAISQGYSGSLWCLVTSPFESSIVLFEIDRVGLDELCLKMLKEKFSTELSVIPSSSLMNTSPLNAKLKKVDPKPLKKSVVSSTKAVKDQALVFHTQVKSSGYSASPQQMFKPTTNFKKKSQASTTPRANANSLLMEFPCYSSPPCTRCKQLAVSRSPTPVTALQYSGDGKQIVCGLGDSSLLLYNSSLDGNPAVYTGHNKSVNTVCWSHSKRWFLSTSEDRTVHIWTSSASEPILTMGDDQFAKSIRNAQFYYQDKFLLLALGSNLRLYLYHLDPTRDDIKRYKQRSKCKLSSTFNMTSGTNITSMSAINDFYSYIVLAGGADRSIQVFDMNQGCVASHVPDAQCQAVYHLSQNKGSLFCTQTPESYNLFLSSAITDGLKMWDLRSLRCVRHYESHRNRSLQCSAAFSPCGRFIACGSEDHSAYIYDTRSSKVLHKLQRHSETVINVAFNPANPEHHLLFSHHSSVWNVPSDTQGLETQACEPGFLVVARHLDTLWDSPCWLMVQLLTGTLDGKLALFRPNETLLS